MYLGALFAQYPVLLPIVAGLFGLVIGSSLNVVIHRLPVMLERGWRQQCQEMLGTPDTELQAEAFNLVVPRSRCPHCGHAISAWENIPVLSFLWLKGRCAECKRPISRRYPAVELLTAILSALVAWHFGWHPATAAALLLIFGLIALTFIDLDHQILPDVITLPFLWLGLAVNLFAVFTDLHSAVIGAIAGYVSLWLVFHAFKLATGREGMGFGDFKLFALAGAWLGWKMLPLVILFASLVGAVVGIAYLALTGGDRRQPIPFGPFLCAATLVALLWGEQMVHAYLRFAHIPL